MTQHVSRFVLSLTLVGLVGGAAATASAHGSTPPAYMIYDLGPSTTGLSVSPNGAYVGGFDITTEIGRAHV